MKNTIVTGVLLLLVLTGSAQSSVFEANTLVTFSGVQGAAGDEFVKTADCVGEWVSADGFHLTLLANNKAVWKDDGHIYYATWHAEYTTQGDKIKISIVGNNYCKHTSFYLAQTEGSREIVEDQTNLHLHIANEATATLQ